MCKTFHAVLFRDRERVQDWCSVGQRLLKRVKTHKDGTVVTAVSRQTDRPIVLIAVQELSLSEHHQLREGSEIYLCDEEGFLHSGQVEYEPKYKKTTFLEIKIRYGKSERANINYTKEGRTGPMLLKKVSPK